MGNVSAITTGEIQVMSAGTGLHHSEYNQSREQNVEFLQIWVFPDREGVKPRYENAVISDLIRPNELCVIVSPYPGDGHGGLWIYQQAWFSWESSKRVRARSMRSNRPAVSGFTCS